MGAGRVTARYPPDWALRSALRSALLRSTAYSGTSTYDYNRAKPGKLIRNIGVIQPLSPPGVVSEIQVALYDGTTHAARLTCTCHQFLKNQNPWCLHIETCISKAIDARDTDGNKVELPPVLEIPLYRDPWLAVPVVLGPSPIQHSKEVTIAAGAARISEGIGFIFIGQGRRDIRTLVEEWLVERAIKDLPACQATHHWRKLPWENTKFLSGSRFHMANLADLLITGQCRSCNEDEGIPDV